MAPLVVVANVEQAAGFVAMTVLTIGLTSMLAHSTLFGAARAAQRLTALIEVAHQV